MVLPIVCLALAGCASATVDQCLKTPVSSKVSLQSVETCEAALQEDLDRQDVFQQTVGLLRERARFAEIVSWSKRVLTRSPKRPDALYQLAYGLRKTGDCAQALKQYLAYAELNADDPDPFFGMGLCYLDLGDREGATRSFSAYLNKERRASQREWVERARQHLRVSSGGGPLAAAPVAAPAVATAAPPVAPMSATPPPSQASPAPAVTGSPVMVPAPAAPAAATAALPAAAPAPRAAPPSSDCSAHERAIAADPFATAAYDQWAECAAKAGRHADIVRRMRTALRDNPEWSRGLWHLGRAFKAQGDVAQAKAAFAKACTAGVSEGCGQ